MSHHGHIVVTVCPCTPTADVSLPNKRSFVTTCPCAPAVLLPNKLTAGHRHWWNCGGDPAGPGVDYTAAGGLAAPADGASLPFLDLPLPFLDHPLSFPCLSSTFHCLFSAFPRPPTALLRRPGLRRRSARVLPQGRDKLQPSNLPQGLLPAQPLCAPPRPPSRVGRCFNRAQGARFNRFANYLGALLRGLLFAWAAALLTLHCV